MCGRFTITTDRVEFILKKFHAVPAPGFGGWNPRYNAAPGQLVPAIVAKEDGKRYLTDVFWGFIPPWGEKGDAPPVFQANIRDDTISRNKFFRARLLSGRCIFLADGFYEWQKPPGYEHLERGKRLPRGVRKIPHRIHLKDAEPFPLAGLWRTAGVKGTDLLTAAIITTRPNSAIKPIHDRMPVILGGEELSAWLDPGLRDFDILHALLDPYPPGEMTSYVVSDSVNNSRNDNPACIAPADHNAHGGNS